MLLFKLMYSLKLLSMVTWILLFQVTVLLRGDDYYPENKKEKQAKNMRRTYSEEIFDAKEYNSTKHLNEMRRHRQIAFGAIE